MMEKMLSDIRLEDMADSNPKKSWNSLDYLSEVARVVSYKYDTDIAAMLIYSSQQRQRLIKEKALKKPINNNTYLDEDDDNDDEAVKSERLAKNQKSVIIKKNNQKKKDKKVLQNNNNRKKKDKKAQRGPEPPPDMPLTMKIKMSEMGGGSETLVLVMQKELTKIDCRKGQNCLSMPIAELRNEFLRDHEKAILKMRDEGEKLTGIQLLLIDPQLDEWKINLKTWDMVKKAKSSKTRSMHVLVNPWNDIVDKNNFHEGVVVQVWSFRVASELCLAIVKLPQTQVEDDGASTSSGTQTAQDDGDGASTSRRPVMAFDIQE